MAIVLRQTEISAGTSHCVLAIPWKRGGSGLYCRHSLSHPPGEGMGFAGVEGRLPVASFSGSRQSESAGLDLVSRARTHMSADCSSSRPPEVGSPSVVLRGAVSPNVLKGYGPRVSLPAAHCSDIYHKL